jgi:hypothetical protein
LQGLFYVLGLASWLRMAATASSDTPRIAGVFLRRPHSNKVVQSDQSEQGNVSHKIFDTDDIVAEISVIVERVSLGCQVL